MEESKKIKVYLDGKEVWIFKGMKVKHMLSTEVLNAVRKGEKYVVTSDGHKVGLEGNLSQGERVFVKKHT